MLDTEVLLDPIVLALGATSLLKLVALYSWRNERPQNAECVAKVTELTLFPVKSAGGIDVDEITCDFTRGAHNGTVCDREWLVCTDDYSTMITIRQEPSLAKLQTMVSGQLLTLSAEGRDPITVDIREVVSRGRRVKTSVHGHAAHGLDGGDAAARWLSDYLQRPARLMYAAADVPWRRVIRDSNHIEWTKVAGENDVMPYHDATPYNMVSQESLDDLNSKLKDPVPMKQFRPNFVCDGAGAFAEDDWKEVYIGNAKFLTAKLCNRCVLVTVSPKTGLKDPEEEPLKTLRDYRKLVPSYGISPCFGTNLVLQRPGKVRLGDPIYVVRGENKLKPA